MPPLQIYLLGRFEVLRAGTPVAGLRTQKARALLVYLALHAGMPLARAALAGLFWPEQPTTRAAHNLRQALTFLRRSLRDRLEAAARPDSPLLTTRSTATFNLTGEHWLDVAAFERRLAVGEESPSLSSDQAAALAEAVRLYRGPLLTGFFVDGAPEFETWLLAERERLQTGALAALDRLAEFHLVRGEYTRARDLLLRALALDAWHEAAYRGLMRALALAGHPNAALAQYEKCRRALAEGLGVEPLEATQILYRQILTGEAGLRPAHPSMVGGSRPQPIFAGRADEHAQLASALAAVNARSNASDRSVVVLVEGEVGTGKTRLVEEFTRFAASQGAVVLTGRCFEFGEMVAYQPMVEALRSALSKGAGKQRSKGEVSTASPLPGLLSPIWLAELSRLLPELRELYPHLPEPQQASDKTAQQRLFTAVARFLRALAHDRRLVVVFLDDLHWADTATLDLLHYLARQAGESRLLFVGAYRPEETQSDHQLTILRRGLSRDHLITLLPLQPLTQAALQAIAENLVEAETAPRFAQYLYRESEGNPFVMTEALNALYDAGVLRLASGDRWRLAAEWEAAAATLTTSLRDAILRRVERLPEPARDLLQLAAVIGRTFDAALLRVVSGAAADGSLETWLEQGLVRSQVVHSQVVGVRVDHPTGNYPTTRLYDFAHDKIREVVYRQLSDVRRSSLHGQVGAALERRHAADPETVAPALAYHYLHGPEPKRALPFLLMAARQTLAFTAITHYCSQALDLEPDDLEMRYEFLRLRQRAYEMLGEAEAEGADAEAMLAVAEALDDPRRTAAALHRLSLFYALRGQLTRGRSAIERSLTLYREAGDSAGEIDALVLLAISIRDVEGDPRQAFNLFEESRKLARATGNQEAEAHNLGHIAILRAEWGEYTAAVENYQECLTLFRAAGLRQDVAGYLNPLASLYRALGQYELAEAALDEALRISVEVRHAQIQGWTHINLGRLALELGQQDRARESYARTLDLAMEHHMPLIEAHALLGLGRVHLADSDFNAASRQLSHALELFAGLDTGAAVLTRAYMGLAHLGLEELDTALTYSRAALEFVEAGVGTFLEVQQVYLYHYRVLRAMGATVEARCWLEKGRSIVLAQADKLDADWRATFLGVTPVNREIMAAWEEVGINGKSRGE